MINSQPVILYQARLDSRAHTCTRCGDVIPADAVHRHSRDKEYRYCVKCVGFIMSRYSMSYVVPYVTPAEFVAKKKADRDWGQHVYKPQYLSSVGYELSPAEEQLMNSLLTGKSEGL